MGGDIAGLRPHRGVGQGALGLPRPLRRRRLTAADRLRRRLTRLVPTGRPLAEAAWRRRHLGLVRIAIVLSPLLAGWAAATGEPFGNVTATFASVFTSAAIARWAPLRPSVRQAFAAQALASAACIFDNLLGGSVEGNLALFVVVGLLTMYQAWGPYLVALVYVVVEHGVIAQVFPTAVSHNPQALAHPWRWAFIYGGFVLAASLATLVSWRLSEQESLRDKLTDIPNRDFVIDAVSRMLGGRRAVRGAVVVIDLDNFKDVNDTFGPQVGDDLLRAVAARLHSRLSDRCVVARLGGDEFALVVPGPVGCQAAMELGQEAITELADRPMLSGAVQATLHASVGVALVPEGDGSAGDVMRDADLAMYEAKRAGGGRAVLYQPSMHEAAMRRAVLDAELLLAVERQEFVLHYQPIVELATGRVLGTEALIRWQHPERGLVYPGDFIKVAEENGLIVAIGEWALRAACRQTAAWQRSWPDRTGLTVSVNVAAQQFADRTFVKTVFDVLSETYLRPSSLTLELTESSLIEDFEAVRPVLKALRTMDVVLALDDFGTGYSSLSYLRQLPVSYLKIDRSFVQDLATDPLDEHIVAATVTLAHALGMSVTAEGVETQEQVEPLKAMGVERAQGYLFGKPVDAATLEGLLAKGSALGRAPRPRSAPERPLQV